MPNVIVVYVYTYFICLISIANFCHAMLWLSAANAVVQCLSVRPSVCLAFCHVVSIQLNISSNVLRSDSHTILVFLHQTFWQYSLRIVYFPHLQLSLCMCQRRHHQCN